MATPTKTTDPSRPGPGHALLAQIKALQAAEQVKGSMATASGSKAVRKGISPEIRKRCKELALKLSFRDASSEQPEHSTASQVPSKRATPPKTLPKPPKAVIVAAQKKQAEAARSNESSDHLLPTSSAQAPAASSNTQLAQTPAASSDTQLVHIAAAATVLALAILAYWVL